MWKNPEMTAEDVEIIRRVHGFRLGPIIVHTDDTNDANVMTTAAVLAHSGMSPLDRELWAAEHGRHYTAGYKSRVLTAAKLRRATR